MPRFYKKVRKKPGLSPGTLEEAPDKTIDEKVRITLFDYRPDGYEENDLKSIEEAIPFKDKAGVTWINIDGLHDVGLLEKIGQYFDIHPLVLEDILSASQRPKVENYDTCMYLVLKMLDYDHESDTVSSEQVSILLGPNFVMSFQEQAGDIFDVIRQRIRSNDSRLRKHGADYLAYRLLDTVVDHYFVILEGVGNTIDDLEVKLMEDSGKDIVAEIHRLKRELLFLRKSVWPLREVLSGLSRDESELIADTTRVFLRDVYDHTIQVIDTVENFRDMVSGMLDIYLSTVSNRMNEVMKVLTIIATIFIPLTFIAGIYGMNFENMPELRWPWGYFAVWLVMAIVATIMLIYFRKKRWL